ncbi:hypothetical protein I6A84_09495 [Frankia sp. CNm7]|uniref:Uncharacterized protein n=1 Tax=Frankia nepalensis TaxID=1836974 RepID=A0A937UQL3_9ACTN|nr:hypothetical protein [Frankia nepalensis]MBL7496422.1 hypothetical protein [Frankia nepalensis]MBL7512856.1 hypothetical protein [Frankia nepalensis]MBL7518339.1 hypothetical protein [Frankia nepalensis]MBL7630208.1 hypothetical protein [Frankia nepalensis]
MLTAVPPTRAAARASDPVTFLTATGGGLDPGGPWAEAAAVGDDGPVTMEGCG